MKTKIVSLFVTVLFLVCAVAVNEGYSQSAKKEIKGKKMEKSRGESKYVVPTTDTVVPKPEKSRGDMCCLEFDNYTGYYIDIWIDDVYQGRLSPWQNSYSLCLRAGWTKYYAQTIGGTFAWSDQGACSDSWKFLLQ